MLVSSFLEGVRLKMETSVRSCIKHDKASLDLPVTAKTNIKQASAPIMTHLFIEKNEKMTIPLFWLY